MENFSCSVSTKEFSGSGGGQTLDHQIDAHPTEPSRPPLSEQNKRPHLSEEAWSSGEKTESQKSLLNGGKSTNCIEFPLITQILMPNSSLRKHAYSNILKNSPPKTENFQIKNILIILIFLLKT